MSRSKIFLFAAITASCHFSHFSSAAPSLRGHIPAAAANAHRHGRAPVDQALNLSIGLPLRNQDELNRLLLELYDPASPNYHEYLSTAEFTVRFGPTEQDYTALVAFARSHGFRITTHPNRMVLSLRGTVGQIEKALHIILGLYQHPVENRTFFAPDNEPSLDLDVPILHISGLDNFRLPRPAHLIVEPLDTTTTKPRPQTGSGPNGTYMGKDFRAAYAPNVNLTGAGQFVGLLQFDGYYPNDISSYTAQAGLTNVPLLNVLLDGVTGSPGGNNLEVALDIEMAISMAPGLAGIIVYEGTVGNDILNRMATDNLAKQLSASWSYPGDGTTSQIFQQFAAQGQSFFNASGDDGAYSGFIDQPSDNPYLISVGGTTLSTRGPVQSWLSETTWNWASTGSGSGATGGGTSTVFPIPSWQQTIDMSTNHGSSSRRNIPDVAMVADKVFVRANNGGQTSVGGTSVASPLWAGFMALVNQQAAGVGLPPAGFINPAIYALSQTPDYPSAFHDIKTGNNTNSSSPTLFYATNGYDLCTGLGTPAGQPLINTLAPLPNSPYIIAFKATLLQETCSPTNGVLDPGEPVIMNFALQNKGKFSTTNLVATLQSDSNVLPLSDPRFYGSISANGGVVNGSYTFLLNGTCGDTVVTTLQLQDGQTDFGSVSFTNQLGVPQVTFSQNVDGVSPPALPAGWTTAVSGGASNWVSSTIARYSVPNALRAIEATTAGVTELVSPAIPIQSPTAQLSFRNNYNTEVDVADAAKAFDGGVLEIKIGAGSYTDILSAGATFLSGGYTRTISTLGENPLDGRQAWAGLSLGFINTLIILPPSAASQSIQLRWRFGTDNGNFYGGLGWYIDNVTVTDGYACCSPVSSNDVAVLQTATPNPGSVGQPLSYSITVTNFGPGPAATLSVTDALPASVSFLSASDGCTNLGNYVVCKTPLLVASGTTNFVIQVMPVAAGSISNTVSVAASGTDVNLSNNWDLSTILVYDTPVITSQPSNQIALAGADVIFTVSALGSSPLTYQWTLWGTNLPGEISPSIFLPSVQPSQAGPYAVVITNQAGNVTSDNAILRILVPPTIQAITASPNLTNATISFGTISGLNYWLEYKNSLSDLAWSPLLPGLVGTGSPMALVDTNPPSGPTRFYRLNCN